MEETTKMEEVLTEAAEAIDEITDIATPINMDVMPSGPSKGFVALVAGGVAAIAVTAFVAVKRHKKKKAANRKESDDFKEIDDGIERVDVETAEVERAEPTFVEVDQKEETEE